MLYCLCLFNVQVTILVFCIKQAPVRQAQLRETIHQWAENLDCGISTDAVLLDLFNSVPHERLLLKLNHVSVRGELFRSIKAFLFNRQQRVLCNIGCQIGPEWSLEFHMVPHLDHYCFWFMLTTLVTILPHIPDSLLMTVLFTGNV